MKNSQWFRRNWLPWACSVFSGITGFACGYVFVSRDRPDRYDDADLLITLGQGYKAGESQGIVDGATEMNRQLRDQFNDQLDLLRRAVLRDYVTIEKHCQSSVDDAYEQGRIDVTSRRDSQPPTYRLPEPFDTALVKGGFE